MTSFELTSLTPGTFREPRVRLRFSPFSTNRTVLSTFRLPSFEAKFLVDAKTKNFASKLGNLKADNTVLLVENGENRNLTLSSRNVEGVKLVNSKDVTTYDVLKYKAVLISKSAAEKLSEALK